MIGLLVFAGPALAQEGDNSALCRILQAHNGQGAAYQPGVDVDGKPVAPADFNPMLKHDFDVVEIPVEINLAEKFGIDVEDGMKLEPTVGTFKIYQDGRVMYGEQDLSNKAMAACGLSRESHVEKQEDDKSE